MSIVRRTRSDVDLSKIEWAALDSVDDAAIAAQADADADTAPIFTTDELARARRVTAAPDPEDVRAIRRRLALSQEQFAARFGFSVDTIRNYEQGHRRPAGPARVLLRVIASDPDAVTRALARRRGWRPSAAGPWKRRQARRYATGAGRPDVGARPVGLARKSWTDDRR